MTLPTWPVSVPSQARDGWNMPQMFQSPIATEMDGGNQRLRSMPGSNVARINYPLTPLDATQYAAFETFFRTTLNNGASRWTMTLTTGNGQETKTVQLDQGKSPTVSREGDVRHVVLPLRVYGM
jgi:hypothetical protein